MRRRSTRRLGGHNEAWRQESEGSGSSRAAAWPDWKPPGSSCSPEEERFYKLNISALLGL